LRSTLTLKYAQVRVPPLRRGTYWPLSVRRELFRGLRAPGPRRVAGLKVARGDVHTGADPRAAD